MTFTEIKTLTLTPFLPTASQKCSHQQTSRHPFQLPVRPYLYEAPNKAKVATINASKPQCTWVSCAACV